MATNTQNQIKTAAFVKDFVLKVVEDAGPNPCPPIVVGVSIGGTFDKAALLAKKALIEKWKAEPKYEVRRYNRCKICGRPHSIKKPYYICRLCLRELYYAGINPKDV